MDPKPLNFSDPMTYVMMAGVSIPEQATMYLRHPNMPLLTRLSVSGVMFAVHFCTNGLVDKAPNMQMELPWIGATAAYAAFVSGSTQTGLMVGAADLAMTFALRNMM